MKEQYEVKRLDRPVDWTVDVPGSKSMTNRALLMAALSDGEVKLEGVLFSDDSRHFLESLVSLGFMVDINESEKAVTREFDTLKFKKVPQSLETGLFFCQIFIFII